MSENEPTSIYAMYSYELMRDNIEPFFHIGSTTQTSSRRKVGHENDFKQYFLN